ncbi:MAG: hypothetical protein IPH89_14135 [Bacteroidetes bacterium]|nr:hypothetical protein [Bacteroidota bacterium]
MKGIALKLICSDRRVMFDTTDNSGEYSFEHSILKKDREYILIALPTLTLTYSQEKFKFGTIDSTTTKDILKDFCLSVNPSCSVDATKSEWNTYRDTVNTGFIMTFKYPENLFVESIENGRCVGELTKPKIADDSVPNTMKWCIWMSDTATETIDSLISSQKYFYKGKVTEQRENITINHMDAVRVTFISNDKNDPYRQMIYIKKYSTLFEIINNYGVDKNFEIFYNSLIIEKN